MYAGGGGDVLLGTDLIHVGGGGVMKICVLQTKFGS